MTPQVTHQESPAWTAVDLVDRFGPIPLSRVRLDPPSGAASEEDVVAIHDREGRLFELVDGILLEKTAGTYEAWLAMRLGRLLGNHVEQHNLGLVLGADGMLRLAPGLVRIPDVSFLSWERLPTRAVPDTPIAQLAPDLAVEIISRSNTRREMERKLDEYFDAGTRLVWYVYRLDRQVHVYDAPDRCVVLDENDTLDGGTVLPGFNLPLTELFRLPTGDGG
jgi:Uma2 family endonuclease